MKNIYGIVFFVIALCILNAALSCSLTGENNQDADGIAAPSTQQNGSTIVVTSAAIKDESFLNSVQYANIFRRSSSNSGGTSPSEWVNIGQVIPNGTKFTAFSFIDYYVNPAYYYSYCIRYYNGESYFYSDKAGYVTNVKGIGEQSLDSTLSYTAYYYRNDASGLCTLTMTSPDPITGIEENFDELCIILTNGTQTKSFTFAESALLEDSSDGKSKQLACANTEIELRKLLPTSFLDVMLSAKGLVLMRQENDTDKQYYTYYWTAPQAVGLTTWTIDAEGDNVEGLFESPASITSFVVPSVPSPSNGFDASSLSLSAKTALQSADFGRSATAEGQKLDLSAF